jgi:methylenetetrahydrofolate dehydrogenase (NADP+)/methenyltetrahydrofolate cyclohydrolase
MNVINGNDIAQTILSKLRAEVKRLSFTPLFVDVLVGDDPVAASYVKIKAKRAEEIGLKFVLVQMPGTTTTEDLLNKIKKIQQDPFLSGLIIQLPLPAAIDKATALNAIDPRVDVDCLGDGFPKMPPPTAGAVEAVLDSLKLDLQVLKILVIGQGELVGRPVTALLKSRGYDVTIADQSTNNLKDLSSTADVIISGTGHPKLITASMVKPGVILIDCGTSESAGSIVGDVDSESVASIAKFIATVPGGVGPVTVAKLLQNVVKVAQDLE